MILVTRHLEKVTNLVSGYVEKVMILVSGHVEKVMILVSGHVEKVTRRTILLKVKVPSHFMNELRGQDFSVLKLNLK